MRVVLGVTHSDENFILRIEDEQVPPDDRIQAVAYSEHNRLLCAGTSKGYILFWRQTSVCLRSSPSCPFPAVGPGFWRIASPLAQALLCEA